MPWPMMLNHSITSGNRSRRPPPRTAGAASRSGERLGGALYCHGPTTWTTQSGTVGSEAAATAWGYRWTADVESALRGSAPAHARSLVLVRPHFDPDILWRRRLVRAREARRDLRPPAM